MLIGINGGYFPAICRVCFILLAFKSVGGLSATVCKALKTIFILSDDRSLQHAGLSLAFSRLSESVSVTVIREPAIMLISDVRLKAEQREPVFKTCPLREESSFKNIYPNERGQSLLMIFWCLTQ